MEVVLPTSPNAKDDTRCCYILDGKALSLTAATERVGCVAAASTVESAKPVNESETPDELRLLTDVL